MTSPPPAPTSMFQIDPVVAPVVMVSDDITSFLLIWVNINRFSPCRQQLTKPFSAPLVLAVCIISYSFDFKIDFVYCFKFNS